jgi:acyl-coenzyme A synthetase/AMP-(fatty) acid ligase
MFSARLSQTARAHPERIALVSNGAQTTFGELARRIERLAAWLLRAGIHPGDTVGLTLRDGYQNIVAALAIQRVGAAHLLLPTHDSVALRTEIAARAKLRAAIVADAGDALPGLSPLIPDFDRLATDGELAPTATPMPGDADVALVAASSGTTGRAKLVPVTQRQLHEQTLNACWPSKPHTLYSPIPVEFYAAQRQHLQTLCLGGTCVFWDPAALAMEEGCSQNAVTALSMSATQMHALVDEARAASDRQLLPKVKVRLFGSKVGPELRRAVRQAVTDDFEVIYGATEIGMIAIAGPGPEYDGIGCLGRAPAGISVEAVDDFERACAPVQAGTIRVRSAGMVDGYLDDAELGQRAFRNGWFYPGDEVAVGEDGLIVLMGRSDDMMNLSGIKVSPREIESVAETFPGVIEAVAFPLKSRIYGDIPVLAVGIPGAAVEEASLLAFCRARLGPRAPRRIVALDRLPRTAAGKVAVGELRVAAASRSGPDTGDP